MGIHRPTSSYLVQENDWHLEVEDGNLLEDSKGNGGLLIEYQVTGTTVSPLLSSIPLFFTAGLVGSIVRLSEV